MAVDFLTLTSGGHAVALGLRERLAAELGLSVGDTLKRETCCLSLLAGAGTRWKRTLEEAKQGKIPALDSETLSLAREFSLDWPRGLFPVRNYIGDIGGRIPMAAYAIDAFKRLGNLCIVIRGWEEEIRQQILSPLDIQQNKVRFLGQCLGPLGKPLGHGDAVYQAMGLWRRYKYLIVNFAGDANSPFTALLGLRCMQALENQGLELGLLLPAAPVQNPAYPIYLDAQGIPRSLGHAKLKGQSAAGESGSFSVNTSNIGYTNVGIRVYRTDLLAAAMEEMRALYWKEGWGYAIPGNDPAQREFALDNVEEHMARRGQARIFAAARPEELTPAKSFDEINNFEKAVKAVRMEWDGLTARSK